MTEGPPKSATSAEYERGNALAAQLEELITRTIPEERRIPALNTIIRLLREGDIVSAGNTFWWEADKMMGFHEVRTFLKKEFPRMNFKN
jgi:hypothetical protein